MSVQVEHFCVVHDRSGLYRALLSSISVHEELVGRDDLSYLEACELADKLNSVRDVLDN